MPLDILALRYAVLAADTLSFARAATQAGVKQATLSKRIASLENRLGLKLFERTTRGATPTEAGLDFLDVARRVLTDLDTLHSSGRAIGGGALRLGFSTSLAAGNMRALIADFIQRFPDLRISALEGDRSRLSQALHARTIDFAVICGDLPDAAFKRRPLWSERIMVVLREDHPLAAKDRVYWPDLRQERFIISKHDPGRDLADLLAARLGEPGWRPDVETHEVTRDNVIAMVPVGRYITLATDTVLGRPCPGAVLREVHEIAGTVSQLSYSGFWRKDNNGAALAGLLKLLADRYTP